MPPSAATYEAIMKQRKSAFTLIELLVVIAIIAILAAILFPVFAQAKIAAKATTSLSNNKQLSLGTIMYATDFDDTVPLDVEWNGGFPIWFGVQGSDFAPAQYLIYPYLKNGPVDQDPLGKVTLGPVPKGWASSWWYGYNPGFGYNYTVWSPTYGFPGANGWPTRSPATFTTVGRPADIPLFTERHCGGSTIWYGPGGPLTLYTIEPVDCNDTAADCFTNWGLNDGLHQFGAPWNDPSDGGFTGGVAFRKGASATTPVTGLTTTTFGDGHAKLMTPGAMAIGTNYSGAIQASAIQITNAAIYRFNQQ